METAFLFVQFDPELEQAIILLLVIAFVLVIWYLLDAIMEPDLDVAELDAEIDRLTLECEKVDHIFKGSWPSGGAG